MQMSKGSNKQEETLLIIKQYRTLLDKHNCLIDQQFLTEVQWSELSLQNDENRQQLVIDHFKKDIILQFMNCTFRNKDLPSLIEATNSKEILWQVWGVIGLRKLLSSTNFEINHPNLSLINPKRISHFLGMAANQKEPQLQLETLRLLNNITSQFTLWNWKICRILAEVGIAILSKLLSNENDEILSRVILILGNICKSNVNLNSLLIKEDIIERLVRVADHHNSNKIKLQCCWTLAIFSTAHYTCNQIPANYQLIVSFLCKIIMQNILTFKKLFYLCCQALARTQAAKLIVESRVYEKILGVDIQTDNAFAQPCLRVLKSISFQYGQILIKYGICDFVSKCLFINERQQVLIFCFKIIQYISYSTSNQVESIMTHQNLIHKMVQPFKEYKISIMNCSQIRSIPQSFTQIFCNLANSLKLNFRQFENMLINLGIIETLVQIMRVNLKNQKIINNVLETLFILLKQKPALQTTRLPLILQKLKFIQILQYLDNFPFILVKQIIKYLDDVAQTTHI